MYLSLRDKPKVSFVCPRCVIKTDVTTLSELKPGDHISKRSSLIDKGCCSRFLRRPYRHHCIVSDIKDKGRKGKATVIGYETNDERTCDNFKKVELQEKVIDIDLDVDSYYLISYEDPTLSGTTRVEKARALLEEIEKNSYNVATNNCEHFCYEVCTGNPMSQQIINWISRIFFIVVYCIVVLIFIFFWIYSPDSFMAIFVPNTVLLFFMCIDFSRHMQYSNTEYMTILECRRCVHYDRCELAFCVSLFLLMQIILALISIFLDGSLQTVLGIIVFFVPIILALECVPQLARKRRSRVTIRSALQVKRAICSCFKRNVEDDESDLFVTKTP